MSNMHIHFLIVLLLTYFCSCMQKNESSVIIIGAGASGIAAASRLLQNDFKYIIILEAEDRIGGRIHSVEFGANYVDLGAEWCHGEQGNIVYNLVQDLNLLYRAPDILPILLHSKVKAVDSSFAKELFSIFLSLYDEDRKGAINSLGEHISDRFNDTIHKFWGNNSEKLDLARDSISLFEKWVLSYEGAFSWNAVAAATNYVETAGNQQLSWAGRGYKTILDVLMKKYPSSEKPLPIEDMIILNKEVKKISWNRTVDGKEKVIVTCLDNSKFIVDHVILTVSLGVLKAQHRNLLDPLMPQRKVSAIEELGFDAVFKVFFQFPKKWWSNSFEGYTFVWNSEDLDSSDVFSEGPTKNGKSWITSVFIIIPVTNNDKVLEAWFTGEFVPEIEQCSNETIINGLMYLLTRFGVFGLQDVVRPDKLIWNAWYSNPHFRGTYSYETIESRICNNSKAALLSEPLFTSSGKLSLMFAGEATHPSYFSTVHGAIDSGFREADRLLESYK